MARSLMNRLAGVSVMAIAMLAALLMVSQPGFAFPIPERLVFDVSYTGIPAGRAVQEIKAVGNELHIVSTAHSDDWLKIFFPVDDRIESILIAGSPPLNIGVPRFYRERISEGRTKRHKEATFNRQRLEVHTKDLLKKKETTQRITKQTYDTLSSFYFFRSIPLTVGNSYFLEIFDGKKLWNTEVKVLRREVVETPLGKFNTVLIKPLLKFEGIFARTGDLYIWLTDDERRIPVQMKSKVTVGSITAKIVGGTYWPDKK